MPNLFYTNELFYFKQLGSAYLSSFKELDSLNVKMVLFQALQLSSVWLIDKTLSIATFSGQSWPGSDGNESVLPIPHSSIRFFSVISRTLIGGLGLLPLSREAVEFFYSTR